VVAAISSKFKSGQNREDRTNGRRRFLKITLFSALAAFPATRSLGSSKKAAPPEKLLSLFNIHTGESLEVAYWSNGRYRPDALADINHILRDHRSGEIHTMDLNLLNLLHTLSQTLEARAPFHVISGYRSQTTNAMLRAQGHGVASGSLHVEGKAIDIRHPEVDLADLRRAAIDLCAGGVGYYPRSDFVHVDIGRVRCW
jgi:uncharacterized protein YcbK (DUF882 family)